MTRWVWWVIRAGRRRNRRWRSGSDDAVCRRGRHHYIRQNARNGDEQRHWLKDILLGAIVLLGGIAARQLLLAVSTHLVVSGGGDRVPINKRR